MALSPKQQRFCDEYLIDLNATAAYKRAGYTGKGKSAENAASRLLGNVGVAQRIQLAMDKRSGRIQRDADDVLRDILSVKEDAVQRISDRDGNQVMADRSAALKALELEGRHYKMFTDKVEVAGKDGGNLKVDMTLTPDEAYLKMIGR